MSKELTELSQVVAEKLKMKPNPYPYPNFAYNIAYNRPLILGMVKAGYSMGKAHNPIGANHVITFTKGMVTWEASDPTPAVATLMAASKALGVTLGDYKPVNPCPTCGCVKTQPKENVLITGTGRNGKNGIDFELNVPSDNYIEKCVDIYKNPSKYSNFADGSKEAYYKFIDFLWLEFDNGNVVKLESVAENRE